MDTQTQDFLFWLKKMSLELPEQVNLAPVTALLSEQQRQIVVLQQQCNVQSASIQDMNRQMQRLTDKLDRLLDHTGVAQTAPCLKTQPQTQRAPVKRRMLIEPTPEELARLGSSFLPTMQDTRSTML